MSTNFKNITMDRKFKRESMRQIRRLQECVEGYLNFETDNEEKKQAKYLEMKKKWHKFVEKWNARYPKNPSSFSSFDDVIKNRTNNNL